MGKIKVFGSSVALLTAMLLGLSACSSVSAPSDTPATELDSAPLTGRDVHSLVCDLPANWIEVQIAGVEGIDMSQCTQMTFILDRNAATVGESAFASSPVASSIDFAVWGDGQWMLQGWRGGEVTGDAAVALGGHYVDLTKAQAAASATASPSPTSAPSPTPVSRVWTYYCGNGPMASLQDVWTSGTGHCGVSAPSQDMDGWVLDADQQAAVDVVVAGQGPSGENYQVYQTILNKCVSSQLEVSLDRPWWSAAALMVCPDAPHAPDLQLATELKVMPPGRAVIGVDHPAGTYKSEPDVADCFWERSSGSGETVDNDFVTYAPDGVTVTVREGEGFTSARCGYWRWIG